MKNLLSLLISILSFITFGQNCDTSNGKLINCIDQNGLKQGYWESKNKEIISTSHHCFGTCCREYTNFAYYILSKELYKDGKKVGISEYYTGDKDENLIKRINYLANGDVIEENLKGSYSLKINADSTLIEGSVYREIDTIAVLCNNKVCNFKTAEGLQLIRFEFIDIFQLEYEILSLQMYYYDTEIRKMKARIH